MPKRTRMLALRGVLLIIPSLALGQSTSATITGQVADPSKAVLQRAAVRAINNNTNVRYEALTNQSGTYLIPSMPPGDYRIEVEKTGFRTIVKPDIILHVQDTIELNFEMAVGSASETVTVEGGAPLVNAESASVSTVVDRQFVENIPLNGRTFQSLIALTPGIVFTGQPPNTGSGGTGQFSVNGQRSDANSFNVDGVSANFGTSPGSFLGTQGAGNIGGTTALGTTQSLASADAIQEFRVQTSTYSAEFGRQPGGQISIVTRSGTNSFHGLLFDYLRNDKFDANDWFANSNGQPRPPERQNDFGGTFGGPVRIPFLYNGKDKTFFFFSYEGLRLRLPKFALTNVPTLCLRGKGGCGSGQLAAPAALQPILNSFPAPNGRDLGNGFAEFSTSYTDPSSLDATGIRIDHNLTQNWNLFGRYNDVPSVKGTRGTFDLSVLSTSPQHARTLTLGLNGVLSPRSTNEFRFNYTSNTAASKTTPQALYGATPVAISDLLPPQFFTPTAGGFVVFDFPGLTAGSFNTQLGFLGGLLQDQRLINVTDNFSLIRGDHHFKFGIDWREIKPHADTNSSRVDVFFLAAQSVFDNSATQANISGSRVVNPIFKNFSAYGQDSWKVSRRLTLDLGVRWDVNPAPGEASGNLPLAVKDVSNLATLELAPYGTKTWATTYNNFAPRVGAAYQLSQHARRETVVRGGFGIFYDTGNAQGASGFAGRYPYPFLVNRTITTGVSYPLSPAVIAPNVLPDPRNLIAPYGSVTVFDPHLKLPYTLGYSFAVQQSLGKDQAMTLTYVGNSGQRLLQQLEKNLIGINPKFTTIGLTTNNATSSYNALQAQFQRRLSRGFQILASYTWSHALDFDSNDSGRFVPAYGNSFYDVRHNFSAALTYDVPVHTRYSVVNAVFGAWSVDSSFLARTGFPLDLIARQVTDSSGNLTAVRPSVIAGQPLYIDDSRLPGGRAINRTAFSIPSAGQVGNLGRNVVRGFGMFEQNLGLRREFKIWETMRLQLKGEAFNIYNHPNFGAVQTTLTSANFGQATGLLNQLLATGGSAGRTSSLYTPGGPRSLEFAIRLSF
ncbi:MAG: carboxypeptidase regulatory-like domain-containing protein [Bryobacteraceae bacterium]